MSIDTNPNQYQQQKQQRSTNEKSQRNENGELATNHDKTTFLVLGDGDFSYSLDLCRFFDAFLSTVSSEKVDDTAGEMPQKIFKGKKVEVRVTGIDTEEELKAKYRDSDSILRKIRALDCNSELCRTRNTSKKRKHDEKFQSHENLIIHIHHNVNAIQAWNDSLKNVSTFLDFPLNHHKHVIFNHPHVGKEDAALHGRFISHLFHSARNYWLEKGGVIHITLVLGQCERWKCLDSAKLQNMTLLHRGSFQPPPSPGVVCKKRPLLFQTKKDKEADFHLYYHERRHQNGRSFANRASGGSETLTFGRIEDEELHKSFSCQLPWSSMGFGNSNKNNALNFICDFCDKAFREKRSLKNHIKSVHDNIDINPQNRHSATKTNQFSCEICEKLKITRIFSSAQALEDHKSSKHFLFKVIKPEWASAMQCKNDIVNDRIQNNDNDAQPLSNKISETRYKESEKCQICEFVYTINCSEEQHFDEFIPPRNVSEVTNDEDHQTFQCSLCTKLFVNQRALLQHKNFCYRTKDSSKI